MLPDSVACLRRLLKVPWPFWNADWRLPASRCPEASNMLQRVTTSYTPYSRSCVSESKVCIYMHHYQNHILRLHHQTQLLFGYRGTFLAPAKNMAHYNTWSHKAVIVPVEVPQVLTVTSRQSDLKG